MELVVKIISLTSFLIMGIGGLVSPQSITKYFDLPEISIAMQNEVRAVYGGFGIVIASLLFIITFNSYPKLEVGVLLTVSMALLGMALGRIVSFFINGTIKNVLLLFLFKEAVLGMFLMILFLRSLDN